MKRLLLALMLLSIQHLLPAQTRDNHFKSAKIFQVKSISPADEDLSDLVFLKDLLKGNRVLLLGEQSHREGATFQAKVKLIRFLHEEMGYDLLCFESGLYDNYLANLELQKTGVENSALRESVYPVWSEISQFQHLIEYIHERLGSDTPLHVAGFDSQTDHLFKERFLPDLYNVLNGHLHLDSMQIEILEQVVSAGPEFLIESETDSLHFARAIDRVTQALNNLALSNDPHVRVLRQTFLGWISNTKWEIDILNGVSHKAQNPRDEQMARNLIFLADLHPDKKIIAWGASYHFANELGKFRKTELTELYSARMDSLVKSEEKSDIFSVLDGAIPMGKVLREHFGDKVILGGVLIVRGELWWNTK